MDLRQMTYKNDPRPTIKLPTAMLQQIEEAAKKDGRSVADELMRRVGRAFRDIYAAEYREIASELKPGLQDTIFDAKHNKCISREILEALQDAAEQAGHSVDMEVALRVGATFARPDLFGAGDLLTKILTTRRTKAAEDLEKAECAILAAAYYERKKLRDFMARMDGLPKTFTERFQYINVEAEATRILRRMTRDARRNHDEKWHPAITHDWNSMKQRIEIIVAANTSSNDPEQNKQA